jgi:hypothetical protein
VDAPLVVALGAAELVVDVTVDAELVPPELVVLEAALDEAELVDRLDPEPPQAVTPSSTSIDADKAHRARNAPTTCSVTPVTVARSGRWVRSAAAMPARAPPAGRAESAGDRGAPQAEVATKGREPQQADQRVGQPAGGAVIEIARAPAGDGEGERHPSRDEDSQVPRVTA